MDSLKQAMQQTWERNKQAYEAQAAATFAQIQQKAAAARPPASLQSSPPSQESQSSPKCPICDGLGVVTRDVPVDHPDFGKAFPCQCRRADMDKQQYAKLVGNAGIPERHKELTFETFLPFLGERNEVAFQYCQVAAAGPIEAEGLVKPGLVLYGRFGVGKTGLAAATINERMKQGQSVLWIDYARFISRVQRAYSGDQGVNARDIVFAASSAPVAVIDDMGDYDRGNQPISNDQRRITYEIISYRHERVMPTLITTNLEPGQFEAQFGARIYQRIVELCHVVPMGGQSLRR